MSLKQPAGCFNTQRNGFLILIPKLLLWSLKTNASCSPSSERVNNYQPSFSDILLHIGRHLMFPHGIWFSNYYPHTVALLWIVSYLSFSLLNWRAQNTMCRTILNRSTQEDRLMLLPNVQIIWLHQGKTWGYCRPTHLTWLPLHSRHALICAE